MAGTTQINQTLGKNSGLVLGLLGLALLFLPFFNADFAHSTAASAKPIAHFGRYGFVQRLSLPQTTRWNKK